MTPTETMLLAVHRSPAIPLKSICVEWFGMSHLEARRKAALHTLPVPVWPTTPGKRSPLMVRLSDLAKFVDDKAASAATSWSKSQL